MGVKIKAMKKLSIILAFLIGYSSFISCDSNDDGEIECGTHNGNTLYKGPQDGCYYYNSNGNKTYVDRSECNC